MVKKLGSPASDRWLESRSGPGGYRRLWYPRRGVTVILTGASRNSARYAGTLNRDGEIIHSVDAGLANRAGFRAELIHYTGDVSAKPRPARPFSTFTRERIASPTAKNTISDRIAMR